MDGYRELMDAIIFQAVEDYRELRRGRCVEGAHEEEICLFFTKGWGQAMLGKIDGETLIELLDRECVEA